jgi:hypothetical protein
LAQHNALTGRICAIVEQEASKSLGHSVGPCPHADREDEAGNAPAQAAVL